MPNERTTSRGRALFAAALPAVTTAGVLVLWGEVSSWRSSRRIAPCVRPGTEAVVVLGFRNPGHRVNALNRWRVKAAIRSVDPEATQTRLVVCGGAVGGPLSEASLMAAYARLLGFTGEIVLEEESRSTWENVVNVIPLVADAEVIKIVSNPHHVEKAELFLRRQRPDLAQRLAAGRTYRPGEWSTMKPLLAAHGLWDLWRSRRTP